MKKVLAIVGPTASGKTHLSLKIAELCKAEIISVDSRQIYKNIPIATSAPTIEERNRVKHYFVEEIKPEDEYNAGYCGKRAREIIDGILSRNKLPIIVGGSGLYVRSIIDGFFSDEIRDNDIRKKLNNELKDKGQDFLYEILKEVDPESAACMDKTKYPRVIRALEVYYITGQKISELQTKKIKVGFETIQIGLSMDRNCLYDRINSRVTQMLADGLIEEVKKLAEKGYHPDKFYSLKTVGIKEVFQYLENDLSYNEMVLLIKKNTRQYAKKQLTWFRKDSRIKWINIPENPDWDEVAQKLIYDYKSIFKPYL